VHNRREFIVAGKSAVANRLFYDSSR